MTTVREFLDSHFLHFNSRELVAAARAWEAHLASGGKMLVTLAGAMSTARLGKTLARMIRAGRVHAVCCTGANLEEDAFALLAANEYVTIPDWRALRAEDEAELLARGLNRVTDTCIPETVMRHIERRLLAGWQAAERSGSRRTPSQYMKAVLQDRSLAKHFQLPREESWVLAAADMDIPVWTPGWEDSTTGNMFTARCWKGDLSDHGCVKSGTEQFEELMRWYLDNQAGGDGIGFFQVGGGIAGDFAICTVPSLIQDLGLKETRTWGYFCQVSDASTSYGGYSGAVPNEKITWGKLLPSSPKFMIQSDATIVVPLIFAWLLGD